MSVVITSLAAVVDRLAVVNAAIAQLAEEAGELKAELVGSAETRIDGSVHYARISYIGPPSRQLIAAHTSLSGGGTRVQLFDL